MPASSAPPDHDALSPAAFVRLLALVLVLALAVRLPLLGLASSSYRLTESFNIEEVENVRLSTGMLHKSTLNPHAFEYPSLFYYLSLAVEHPLRAAGRDRWTDYLVGVRALSLVAGLALVAIVGALAARLGGRWAGVLAATLVAFDRTLMEISALAKPNAAQVTFVLAGFLALASFARRPGARAAAGAAALFGLATASKWLGALGLAGLLVAPVLAQPVGGRRGLARLGAAVRAALASPVPVWKVLLPPAVFGAVFLACVPFALLSPREFGFGLAQTFTAQSVHQVPLPAWMPLVFLQRSLGPLGAALSALGVAWALVRLPRWDGSEAANGVVLVLGWALAYGSLLVGVFVRLPSYVDLWVPFLTVLAGCALVGDDGLLRRRGARTAAWLVVLAAGIATHGATGPAREALEARDTRVVAGRWLAAHAGPADGVLADLGAYVPDRFEDVRWNWWGSPPRTVYDESVTWGRDPRWPEWYGGHRRLMFENAKWVHPLERLAARPRWVVTTDTWVASRANPGGASETAAPEYDRALADGSAGYTRRARFAPAGPAPGSWRLALDRSETDGPPLAGPGITIWERTAPAAVPPPAAPPEAR